MYSLSLYVRAPRGSVKTCCPFHSSRIPLQPRSAAAGCVAGPAGGAQDGASPPPSAGTTPAAPPVPVDAATADDVAVGDRGQSRATSRLTNVAACRLVCAGFFLCLPPARPLAPPDHDRPTLRRPPARQPYTLGRVHEAGGGEVRPHHRGRPVPQDLAAPHHVHIVGVLELRQQVRHPVEGRAAASAAHHPFQRVTRRDAGQEQTQVPNATGNRRVC